ncbi:endonuclease/exonuclease/phosphatase [Agathobacter rectalis]|uniref:endonuclease/exonuclease/phosphatase n=1 Tax=Agathobacter rectalis TaxID=39491 RepID=UPI0034A37541
MAEINELNDNLKQCKKRLFNWNTKGCERIHIWGNYIDVTPGEQNKYFSVQIVNKQYIMCGVHMYSNLNGEHYDERVALAEEIMYSIKHIKQRLQTEHVIVIGGINESPYEKACLSAKGFHALPALQILDKGSRTVYGKEYEKMYNPMWNLFGDFKYPPGTYYRVESKLYNPCWFMLDQVIISQSMIPLMVKEQLKIITKCGKGVLYTDNRYPNSNISDHFPIMCEFNI